MPGPGGQQINSLMDMMQPAAPPPRMFGTWDPQGQPAGLEAVGNYSLWSGGAPGLGGGGAQVFSPPPDVAQYFTPFGEPRIDDPRQVAAEGGVTLSQLAGGLLPRYKQGPSGETQPVTQGYEFPSDKGGFFRLEDLFGLTGTPTLRPTKGPQRPGGQNMQVVREGAIGVPRVASRGMSDPSTNNWRLLGQGPGWIMRNGQLIDTRAAGINWGTWRGGTPAVPNTGETPMPPLELPLGAGAYYGVPNLHANAGYPAYAGWPGGVGWSNVWQHNV